MAWLAAGSNYVMGGLLAAFIFSLSDTRVGWVGTNVDGRIAYNFRLFNGDEVGVAQVEAGETLTIDYAANVDRGVLSFRLLDPQGTVVFAEAVETDVSDQFVLNPEQPGQYEIHIVGDNAVGGFVVDWSVQ